MTSWTELFKDVKLSPTTIKSRVSFLNRLGTIQDLSVYAKTIKKVNGFTKNDNTLSTYLFHITEGIRLADPDHKIVGQRVFDKYDKLKSELKQKAINLSNNNILTDKHKAKYVAINNLQIIIRERFIELENNPKDALYYAKEFQNLCILACYVFQPPLRTDWYNIRVVKTAANLSDKENYYVLSTNKLIINISKTNAKQFVIDVRPELSQILKHWIKTKNNIGITDPHLFYYEIKKNEIKRIVNRNTFGIKVKRGFKHYMNENLTINDMRHIYEIELQASDAYKKMTFAAKEIAHNELLHSLCIGLKYNLI